MQGKHPDRLASYTTRFMLPTNEHYRGAGYNRCRLLILTVSESSPNNWKTIWMNYGHGKSVLALQNLSLTPVNEILETLRNKHMYTITLWITASIASFLFLSSKLSQMLVSDNCLHPLALTHYTLLAIASFWLRQNTFELSISNL